MRDSYAVLGNRNYRLYIVAAVFSAIAAGELLIAAPWLAIKYTGEGSAAALTLISSVLPGAILGLWSGVLVDRSNPQRLAFAMDLGRSLALMGFAALLWLDFRDVTLLYVLNAAVSFMTGVFRATGVLLVKAIVPSEDLVAANSLHVSSRETGYLIGTAAAGILLAITNHAWVFASMTAMFAISGALVLAMQIKYEPVDRGTTAAAWWSDLLEGVRYVRAHPRILSLYGILTLMMISMRTAPVLLSPLVMLELQRGSAEFSVIEASWTVGAIVAGVAIPILIGRLGTKRLVLLGQAGLAVGFICVSVSPNWFAVAAAYALVGGFGQSWIPLFSTIQDRVEGAYLGRVQALYSVAFSLIATAVYTAYGVGVDVIGSRGFYLLNACMVAGAAALLGVSHGFEIHRTGRRKQTVSDRPGADQADSAGD